MSEIDKCLLTPEEREPYLTIEKEVVVIMDTDVDQESEYWDIPGLLQAQVKKVLDMQAGERKANDAKLVRQRNVLGNMHYEYENEFRTRHILR